MARCDWIVVPSIWWENSPVVMQEARLAERPIICADIGGMIEKIDPTVDLAFPARSPAALADVIRSIVTRPIRPDAARLRALAEARAAADAELVAEHLRIYRGAMRQTPTVSHLNAPLSEGASSSRARRNRTG
jgi:glycosyltransferase involved in cell wall biosynthesis